MVIDQGNITRDELLSVLSTTMGPTEDLTATMQRLGPVGYELFTLPDTNVIEARVHITRTTEAEPMFDRRTVVRFISSATSGDAAITYATELAAMGLAVEQGEEAIDGIATSVVTAIAAAADGRQNSIEIAIVDRVEGGSIIAVDYLESGLTDLSIVAIANEWQRPTVVPEGFMPHAFVATVAPSPGGDHAVSLRSDFVTEDEAADVPSVQADVRANIENTEFYKLRSIDDAANSFTASFGVVRATIVFGDDAGVVDISIRHDAIVVADSASPPATPGG